MIFTLLSTSENMDSEQKFEGYVDLPKEIRSLILLRCDFSDIVTYSLTCKGIWSEIMEDTLFWKRKIESDFGEEFPIVWESTGCDTYRAHKEKLNEGLYRSAFQASLPGVRKHLRSGADPNWFPNHEKVTALLWVCDNYYLYRDNLKIIEELLKFGADPNLRSDDITPLMVAILNANSEVIRMLLKAGARVNNTTSFGYTALTYAVENTRETAVEILLDWNADVGIRDRDGESALDIARKGDLDGYIIELLESRQ